MVDLREVRIMINFLGRFFEPALNNKWQVTKMMAEAGLSGVWYDLVPIFALPYLTLLVTQQRYVELQNFIIFILLAYVVMWTFGFYIRKWDFETKYVLQKYLNEKYRSQTILKNNLYLEQIGTGKVQSILSKGFYAWVDVNWQVIYQVPRSIIIVAAGIYVTWSLGIIFLSLFAVLFVLSLVGYLYFKKEYLKFEDKLEEEENHFNDNSVRLIMSRSEVVFAGKGEYEIQKLSQSINKQKQIFSNSATYDFLADLCISGNGTLLPFLGTLLFLQFYELNALNVASLTVFLYFTLRFSGMLYHVSWMIKMALDQYPKIKKLWEFFDKIPDLENYSSGKKFVHGNGEIEFQNVSFKYATNMNVLWSKEQDKDDNLNQNLSEQKQEEEADNKIILEDFNLKIHGGEKVAFIGKSGSGKTTLVKLITGYMYPTSGKLLVDGQNIKKLSLKSYYEYVGYLTQEPSVFDGTIKDNLLYGTKDIKKIDDLKIREALEKAQCQFVFNNKKGIHTQIGERGVRLSGGERQRLAIAKLFLKNPEIIILDEPTSALDSFSEELVTKALEELFVGRTVIVIAHRLQTVRNCDRIVVLENGKIVEEGNHASLVNAGGTYSKMLNMQGGLN